MKNLIVGCDGTWNTPDQEDDGLPAPTNVVKLHSCLAASTPAADGGETEQRRYYHPGVGAEGGVFERTAGGAWGHGLSRNIQSACHWLARNYAPGDAIYLFGFSRGAYTVRSLAGLLNKCGLPDLTGIAVDEGFRRIETAYRRGYREREPASAWAEDWAFHHKRGAPVRFIGVWDTVGALGIPDDLTILNLFDKPRNWRFHDTTLGVNVQTARHAVALDEVRASFTPTLWTKSAPDTDLVQTWFAGVHSDVGGGYAETGLSDIALEWMIEQAEAAGLGFEAGMKAQVAPKPLALMHDSFRGVFKAHRSQPRNTPPMNGDSSEVHPSALLRHRTPPLAQAPYWPTRRVAAGQSVSVDVYARERWNATGLWLAAGKYELRAAGEWLDSSVPAGPAGTGDGDFHMGEIAHVVGAGIGLLERGINRITGNEAGDLKFTRRHEQWPWFCLVGAVANSSRRPRPDGTPPAHDAFLIGAARKLTLARPGYLYAYANDAWDFYGNNSGSLQLTVTCMQTR